MVAKRQKAALSVVFILAALLATYIIGLFSTFLFAFSSLGIYSYESVTTLVDRYVYDSMLAQAAVQVVLNAIYIAVYYPITHYAIAHKLNLE